MSLLNTIMSGVGGAVNYGSNLITGGINYGSQMLDRTVVRPANQFLSTNPVTRPAYTAGVYAGNVIRARQLPTPQQYLNAGATIYRQTPLRPVVDAGARFGQVVRTQGVQGVFNAGSRVIQRTPLAAVNTAGVYAGNVIRARQLPTQQQYMNAGANIYRQTPLRPVVDAGARVGQVVRTQGVQGVFNAGSRVIQRTPLAAVNTAGMYTGNMIRARQLPTQQQAMNAGAAIFRQTPLAPVVTAGQQARQNIVRGGGVQTAINRGSAIFQRSPFAAANTLGQYTGNVIRSGRLPSAQQFAFGAGAIARQVNPVPRATGGDIRSMGNLTSPAQDWIGRVESRNTTVNQMQADAKARGWWKDGMVAPPATTEGITFLNTYQGAINSMRTEYDTGASTYLHPNNSTFKPEYVQQNQTAAQPAMQVNQSAARDPRDGSTDVLGKLGRFDVFGAVGAAGKWVETNTIPWAESAPSWLANNPQNTFNLRVAGPLERGELPIPRAYDQWALSHKDGAVAALAAIEPQKGSVAHHNWAFLNESVSGKNTYPGTFAGLGMASRDIFGGLVIGGAAMSAMTIGFLAGGTVKVLGKLGQGDPLGAGSDVVTGAKDAAVGTGTWVSGWPARYAANPRAAPWQIAGEWYGGALVFKGVGKGLGAAKRGASPVGTGLGIVRQKTYGAPDIPFRDTAFAVRSIFENEYTVGAAHAAGKPFIGLERVPGQVLPIRTVRVRNAIDKSGGTPNPGAYFTVGSKHLETYGSYFLDKYPGVVGRVPFVGGRRIYVAENIPNVRVPKPLANRVYSSIETKNNFLKEYPEIIKLGNAQADRLGTGVAIPSWKRAAGFAVPESEVYVVYGTKAANRQVHTQFAGLSPGRLTQVKKVAFGSQALNSTRRGNIRENLAYNWDIGRSGARVYNKNHLRFMVDDVMKPKYEAEFRGGLKYQNQYLGYGAQDHLRPVATAMVQEYRRNPSLQQVTTAQELRATGLFHDIAKIRNDKLGTDLGGGPLHHEFAAAEGIRTGLFNPPEIAGFSTTQKARMARNIELAGWIDPRLYTPRGIRTAAARPGLDAKTLANADKTNHPLIKHPDKSRLFNLSGGGGARGWLAGPAGPADLGRPIAAFGMGFFRPSRFGVSDTTQSARDSYRVNRGRSEYMFGRSRQKIAYPSSQGRSDYRSSLSPLAAPPLMAVGTYRPGRGTSGYRRVPAKTGAYPASSDRLYRTITFGETYTPYGPKKAQYPSGYRRRYPANRGYGENYTRREYSDYPQGYTPGYPRTTPYTRDYPIDYPISYPGTYPPNYPPAKTPPYPPVKTPPYPPVKTPPYPPVKTPPYPPVKTPPYPPVKTPPYPPVKTPPYPPTTPPYNPPYPPKQPPPYEPPYEPPYPPIIPPWNPMNDVPDEQKGNRGGGRAAYDFFEMAGIADPESILKGGMKRKKGRAGKRAPSLLKLPKIGRVIKW